jgi:hypothetical protein
MAVLISEIWTGLRDAGMAEVMLFLPDGTASRCHWNDTAVVGDTRVALLGDQERKIVRIIPVDQCVGIGIASPKGTDPMSYRGFIQGKLKQRFSQAEPSGSPPPAQRPHFSHALTRAEGGGCAIRTADGTAHGPRGGD